MQDIAYDKSKIDLVFSTTEKALEQNSHLEIICERMKVLEQMHTESPNLEAKIASIRKAAGKTIPDAYDMEKETSAKVKTKMLAAVEEMQKIM